MTAFINVCFFVAGMGAGGWLIAVVMIRLCVWVTCLIVLGCENKTVKQTQMKKYLTWLNLFALASISVMLVGAGGFTVKILRPKLKLASLQNLYGGFTVKILRPKLKLASLQNLYGKDRVFSFEAIEGETDRAF